MDSVHVFDTEPMGEGLWGGTWLEVNNVEAIKEALPDGCWKRLKLEP